MRLFFRRPIIPPRPVPPRREPAVLLWGMARHREVALIIVIATAVRLVDFTAPYTSEHWIKQLQLAPIAENFATKSLNILWPETDYSADRPGYIEIEFQLVTWLTALLYKVFGIHEWVGRLVTVSFSVGAMVLLYRLLLMYIGPVAAGYGLVFFAFAPSNWYFSRVLMSEPLMMFFSVAVVYAFSLYLSTGMRRHLAYTALAGALCFLVKLPTVILLIPLAYLAHQKYGKKLHRQRRLWALGAVMLLPAVLYYLHAYFNIGQEYFTVGVGFGGGMWLALDNFLRPGNYSLMTTRLVVQHLTAVGVVLLPLGFFVADKGRIKWTLFHVWLGAVILYFLVVSGGNLRQNYYQLPLLIPAAALVGMGWEQLAQSRRFAAGMNQALAAVFLVLCVWGVYPMFKQYTPIHDAAQELSVIDPAGAPVIIFPAGYGCLYYFDRPGWVGREGFGKPPEAVAPEDVPGPEYIDDRIRRGARWAVYFDVKTHEAQPPIQRYLRERFECVSDRDEYQIFDLTRTPEGRVYRPNVGGEPGGRTRSFLLHDRDPAPAQAPDDNSP